MTMSWSELSGMVAMAFAILMAGAAAGLAQGQPPGCPPCEGIFFKASGAQQGALVCEGQCIGAGDTCHACQYPTGPEGALQWECVCDVDGACGTNDEYTYLGDPNACPLLCKIRMQDLPPIPGAPPQQVTSCAQALCFASCSPRISAPPPGSTGPIIVACDCP